jgi:hypothetical protein
LALGRTPSVIVTDRDKSIRNASKKVFPGVKFMLCSWHIISKNLKDNTRTAFKSNDVFQEFSNIAWRLQNCKTIEKIPFFITELENYCDKHGVSETAIENAKKYVHGLVNEKEFWVKAYVDQFPHFNNYSTGRVESQHSALKRNILLATSLENAFEYFHSVIMSQKKKYHVAKSSNAMTSYYVGHARFYSNIKFKVYKKD